MLDEGGLPLDLPEPARAELALAGAAWEDEPRAEAHVRAAIALAPDALAAQLGAYKFYLYRHRLNDALPHAAVILTMAARRLQLPHDWRDVAPHHAAFDRIEPWPRLFLQALIGTGYALARLGRLDEGREALAKAVSLDPLDRFGAGRLIKVIERGGVDEEEV
jgi:tetratricopeptide (TPR) repeat protein